MAQIDPFREQVVLITGASSGIGEAFARQLAARGAHLILTARRRSELEDLARDLENKHGIRARVIDQDLSKPGAAHELAHKVQALGLHVDLLINNAGFGRYMEFCKSDAATDEHMLRLNVEALTTLSHLFVPAMVKRGRGGVINLASTVAFQPIGGLSVYAASKAYVLSFSQALEAELRGSGVHVLCLCPGTTRTEFHLHSNTGGMSPNWMSESADDVAARGLEAFEARAPVKISGAFNWILSLTPRLLPRTMVARSATRIFEAAKKRTERLR